MLMSYTERGIAVRFRVVFLLLLFGLSFGGDYGAGDLFQKVKSKYGSKEGLRQNAEVPLKTETPMTNLEGTKSFNARIQCPSKREGVRITFLPLRGNDYRLIIEEDLNLDGKMEYRYDSSPVKVSGVCYAGVVSCESGWNNCKFYYWDASPDGYVRLKETSNTALLGGCFCSNSSCGVNSLTQEIVDFVAGGVAQAIMRAKESLAVSKAHFDLSTMSVSLYVQDKSGCSYGNIPTFGEQNPTKYYDTQRPPDGYSYVLSNPSVQTNPYSPYHLTLKASEVKIEGKSISYPSRFSCDIRKDVFIQTTTINEECSQTWTDPNGEEWCVVANFFKDRGGGHCGGYTCRDCSPFEQEPVQTEVVLHYQQKFAIRIENWFAAGDRGGYWYYAWMVDGKWVQGGGNTGAPNCRSFQFFTVLGTAKKEGETHTVGGWQKQDSWGKNHSYPSRFGQIVILKSKTYKGDTLSLIQSNTCSAKEGCVIKNEWVCDKEGKNCIQTIRDGVKTGLTPLPVCYTASTQVRNYTVCAYGDRIEVRGNPRYSQVFRGSEMWFWVKREYECAPQKLSIDLSRAESVIESTTYSASSGTITYRDFGKTYTVQVGTPDSCPVATCVVKTSSRDTSVFADKTNRAQTPGGATTTPFEVRTCQKGGRGFVCPVQTGEEVKEDCRCQMGLDGVGFSYTISVLQGILNASKDMICSSVAP